MKDGYYLSTYLDINEMAYIYGITIRHDQNMSLWKVERNQIQLIRYWELERVTGIKHHNISFFNINQAQIFINSMLKSCNLTLDDIVEIWGTPEIETNQLYIKEEWKEYPIHSLAHLACSFFSETNVYKNENILVIEADGGPDSVIDNGAWKKNIFVCGYSSKESKQIKIIPCDSPGVMWNEASRIIDMQEGSLMALASASKSMLKNEQSYIQTLLVNKRKDIYTNVKKLYNFVFNLSQHDIGVEFNGYDSRFNEKENKISMFMKIVQKASIYIMEENVEKCIREFKIIPQDTILSVTGGYALNCPTNTYLMKKYKFKNFLPCPCVNDSGISMGIALLAFRSCLGRFDFSLKSAYHGQEDKTLEYIGYEKYIESIDDFDENKFIEDIIKNPIIWFYGESEIGPRALGNRSILGDPRNKYIKEQLNNIKKREWWRPVAPIVLNEYKDDWFDDAIESPYMLHAFKIKQDKLKYVPAISHIDNSARVQTLKQEDNMLLYKAIYSYYRATNIPLVCNTSLNDKGEPIINTIDEAFNFAIRKNIEICYINGRRFKLRNHDKYSYNVPLKRPFDFLCYISDDEKNSYKKMLNPLNLSIDILTPYTVFPYLFKRIDITNRSHIKSIKRICNFVFGSSI